MAIEKVLVIDDEELMRQFMTEILERKGIEVVTAPTGKEGIKRLKNDAFDLVFTDMKLPDITGLEVLRQVKESSPMTEVIVITAFGTVENAVEAMRTGAYTYLIKPFTPDTIEATIEKVASQVKLVNENQYLRREVQHKAIDIIGESPAMKAIFKDVERVADSNANVFITGESGTGKEVIAHALHAHSPRNNNPYIRVNCAAIPESLIESELFGHEKGAFTGAQTKRLGRFELADSGTLLLDEVTEIPIMLQAKLLRALQEREFDRVGGTKPVKVDVRIVSTSNRVITEALSDNVLREDLFYRLNVVPITIPPLRERKEDIIPLAEHFLKKYCAENHKKPKTFTQGAREKLLNYQWPGNVRQLGNTVERAVVMHCEEELGADGIILDQVMPVGMTLREIEQKMILETMQAQQNDEKKAAKLLGITVEELRNKMR